MGDYRVGFTEIEGEVAKFVLYEDEEPRDHLRYHLDNLPPGVQREHLGDQFRPEFDEDGELVALHRDAELTERKNEEFKEGVERHMERLEDENN